MDLELKTNLKNDFFKGILSEENYFNFKNNEEKFNNYINYIKENFGEYFFYDLIHYFENISKVGIEPDNIMSIIPKRYIYLAKLRRIIGIDKKKGKNLDMKKVEKIRETLYTIYTNHLDLTYFLKFIVTIVLFYIKTDNNKKILYNLAAQCDINCKKGNKPIIHIESFIYKSYNLMFE